MQQHVTTVVDPPTPRLHRHDGAHYSPCATVFDIQRFSLHDGPGIRTTVFFKGCPLHCAWCQNPESHKRNPEIAFYAERCARCFACRAACPLGAIVEGPRRVDFTRCDNCGRCAAVCPNQALRLIGREWTADALVAELRKDADFFADSGGGVTLCGGEPLLHADFLGAFLPLLKRENIHVCVETCGAFGWEKVAPLLAHTDLVYFDLKHMDTDRHRALTGGANATILENFTRFARMDIALQARLPLIPGINDDEGNIRSTARFLKGAGQHSIHCLPYHAMGEAKLERIETTQKPLGLPSFSAGNKERIQDLFAQEDINAVFYE